MSNVIQFLEQMGRDSELRYVERDRLEAALAKSDIDLELQTAILARDQHQLNTLLGARTNVTCILAPSKDDKDDKDDDDGRGKDDDEVTTDYRTKRRVASAV